ncbi:hypothetical protein TanjilG_02339 [Lupinus angustifolius]|uniref:Outer envelope membrane protein 7 n=1 Tax=Lupinus angustifolius TaxID=3871 RepID=A0A4P1QQP2_LUPAN|nr:hypothetical protein TanjilG_02339 [Lupinus angustifolius]
MGKSKEAVIVVSALAFAWLAIELALKPFLHSTRSNIDPTQDPDDVTQPYPPKEEEGEL